MKSKLKLPTFSKAERAEVLSFLERPILRPHGRMPRMLEVVVTPQLTMYRDEKGRIYSHGWRFQGRKFVPLNIYCSMSPRVMRAVMEAFRRFKIEIPPVLHKFVSALVTFDELDRLHYNARDVTKRCGGSFTAMRSLQREIEKLLWARP